MKHRPGRVCAICKNRRSPRGRVDTYGFKTALREAGLPNWRDDKAHPDCVAELGKKKSP